jgi:hypothetical protein
MSIRVSVTYDVVTEASVVDGDTADNGWIHPQTEARRSLAKGGKRVYARNLRMAQAGKFDWTLRDAVKFISDNQCGSLEGDLGQPYVQTEAGTGPYTQPIILAQDVSVRAPSDGYDIVMGSKGYEHGESVSYTLHVSGITTGTAERLTRVLETNGVRFYRQQARKVG